MAEMQVELVAVERRLWSGPATFVLARTTVGDIGVMPGHEPVLAQMQDAGVVRIDASDGTRLTAAVHGGFLSITPETVTVLAEFAELSEEIDVSRARRALQQADVSDPEGAAAARRAAVRLRAAGASE